MQGHAMEWLSEENSTIVLLHSCTKIPMYVNCTENRVKQSKSSMQCTLRMTFIGRTHCRDVERCGIEIRIVECVDVNIEYAALQLLYLRNKSCKMEIISFRWTSRPKFIRKHVEHRWAPESKQSYHIGWIVRKFYSLSIRWFVPFPWNFEIVCVCVCVPYNTE